MSKTDSRGIPDSFEVRVRVILAGPENQAVLDELLNLRQRAQDALRALWKYDPTRTPLSAEDVNAQNQWFFDQAANLLGPERYEALFGEPPGKVMLVDPSTFNAYHGGKS